MEGIAADILVPLPATDSENKYTYLWQLIIKWSKTFPMQHQ